MDEPAAAEHLARALASEPAAAAAAPPKHASPLAAAVAAAAELAIHGSVVGCAAAAAAVAVAPAAASHCHAPHCPAHALLHALPCVSGPLLCCDLTRLPVGHGHVVVLHDL